VRVPSNLLFLLVFFCRADLFPSPRPRRKNVPGFPSSSPPPSGFQIASPIFAKTILQERGFSRDPDPLLSRMIMSLPSVQTRGHEFGIPHPIFTLLSASNMQTRYNGRSCTTHRHPASPSPRDSPPTFFPLSAPLFWARVRPLLLETLPKESVLLKKDLSPFPSLSRA